MAPLWSLLARGYTSKCHCWSADDGTYHTLLDMRSSGGLPCDIHVHPPSGPDSGLVVLQIPHGSPEYVRSSLAASTSRLATLHSELATMGRTDTPGAAQAVLHMLLAPSCTTHAPLCMQPVPFVPLLS